VTTSQSDALVERIKTHYPDLSEAAQSIANFLQRDPMALVSLSVAELAAQTGTSKATVSRFFRQLGYASHQKAKQSLLFQRSAGYPVHEAVQSATDHVAQDHALISQTFANLPAASLNNVVERICSAKRVILIGYRNSFPVALHFRQQLRQLRTRTPLSSIWANYRRRYGRFDA
jgi:DNA-binding MurR/RpiR family transcriptional regulator